MDQVLKLNNLKIGYHQTALIDSINASIAKGEFVVVLGKNGVGKSTLMNTILGLEKILKGSILLDNQSINGLKNQEISRQIAVVFSKLEVVPQIKVFDLIKTGRIPYHSYLNKLSEDENLLINQTIELVGISSLCTKYATELSEGQLQLVMIARALVQDTPILILDEPTANLDLENQLRIFQLIKKLRKETNKSILMITHEAKLALDFADKIWWIENNKLHEGLPESMAFQHQIIQKLSGNYLQYNPYKGDYMIQTKPLNSQIVNDNELAYWINKALERLDLDLNNNSVEITSENNIIFENQKFETLDSFLKYITSA